jgi:dTDP-4-dehydrorhamnose reductase
MKILVAGRNGQVARALAETVLQSGHKIVCLGRGDLDIRDAAAVGDAFERVHPDIAINAAAYTSVNAAEANEAEAFAVNATGAGNVAAEAARRGIAVIQISTDYVFDGAANAPYRIDAPAYPLNAYGRSKLAGEKLVAAANPRHVILRTQWVYSPWGENFLATMLRLAEEGREANVVNDQTGSPTSALDLARAILAVATGTAASSRWGTYHFTNAGHTTWHGFAEAIFSELRRRGKTVPNLNAVATADYPSAAQRPVFSVLDCAGIADDFGVVPRPWRDALGEVMQRVMAQR